MEVENDEFSFHDSSCSDDPKNDVVIGNPLKKIKINLKGFKKVVQVLSHVIPPPTFYHEEEEAEKKAVDIPKLNNPLKIKINLKGFMKVVQDVSSHVPAVPRLSVLESIEKSKLEATKRKLEQRYHEEAEKKVKRKIQCIDFPYDPKNLGGGKTKALKGDVRERLLVKMKRMKKKNDKPKYTLYSTKIF